MTITLTAGRAAAALCSASAFLVIAGAELATLATSSPAAGPLLTLTMPALLWALVALWPDGTAVRLGTCMITALSLCYVGDLAAPFGVKLAAFGAAHLAYAAGFWPYRRQAAAWPPLLIIPAAAAVVAISWQQPPLIVAALLAYTAVITAGVLLATAVSHVAAAGGVLFMASDLLVGSAALHPAISSPLLSVVAVAFYLAGQTLIVLGVLRAVLGRKTPDD